MNFYYDCTGSMLNAWNGTGLAKAHSIELDVCVSLLNCDNEVKYEGIAQGLLLTSFPLANKS